MVKRSTKGNYDNTQEGMGLNKKVLLQAVEEWGGNARALKASTVSQSTYYRWLREDPGFADDLEQAKVAFGESMLAVAIDRVRNPDKNRGSDVLLIALLNAYLPMIFKPQTIVGEDSARELITEWRQAARREVDRQEALPEHIEETLDSILDKKRAGNGEAQND